MTTSISCRTRLARASREGGPSKPRLEFSAEMRRVFAHAPPFSNRADVAIAERSLVASETQPIALTMKTNSALLPSCIEPLESRIAPAGLVGAVLSPTGQLTLSTVDPDVSVQLEELTGGEWVLTGYAGTTVQLNGGPAQAEVFFKGFK